MKVDSDSPNGTREGKGGRERERINKNDLVIRDSHLGRRRGMKGAESGRSSDAENGPVELGLLWCVMEGIF